MEPLRITRLYLKGFIAIRSVHHKDEIDLVFPKDKIINLFYGDMGTCKTFILGHLQPWHNFGTLDIRNQDKMIPDGENGIKIIEYEKGFNYYIIRHDYIDGGKTTKHYIQKNGEELNENGNLRTFNVIIYNEFGIEPETLKLIRLGDNVTNLLKMNMLDRKKLVASLMKDTDSYLILHKKMTQDYRIMNAQLSGLSQRLSQLGYEKAEEYESTFTDLGIMIKDLSSKLEKNVRSQSELKGEITARLNGKNIEDITSDVTEKRKELQSSIESLASIQSELDILKNLPSSNDIAKKIGSLDQLIQSCRDSNVHTDNELQKKYKELEILKEKKKTSNNPERLQALRDEYKNLHEKLMSYRSQLDGFNVNLSFTQLVQLKGDIEELQLLLETVKEYNSDDVKKIYFSDSSILQYAKKKVDILTATKIKRQKEVNNLKYAAEYSAISYLFRAPLCPSKDCPYYKTHPVTMKADANQTSIQAEIMNRMSEVDSLDVEIYRYCDYTIIYQKIQQIKSMWDTLYPKMSKLNILSVDKLDLIVNDGRFYNWYKPSMMVEIIDLSKKREEMYSLQQSFTTMKDDIAWMELENNNDIDHQISILEKEIETFVCTLRENEIKIKKATSELKEYNEIYLKISTQSIQQEEAERIKSTIKELQLYLADIDKCNTFINESKDRMQDLKQKQLLLQADIDKISKEHSDLNFKLMDIKRTKEEYAELLEEKELWADILDAVSPKTGIPLVIIEKYLNDAKDDVNELIAEVDDDFEIARFILDDDTFQIPYIANGELISDVSKASQGEKSIVNIAIPFALIQNSGIEYNIPLLDEVDAALHTSQRNLFPSIIFKQLKKINSCQVFMISHNWAYDGYPINMILTSDENLSPSALRSITRV